MAKPNLAREPDDEWFVDEVQRCSKTHPLAREAYDNLVGAIASDPYDRMIGMSSLKKIEKAAPEHIDDVTHMVLELHEHMGELAWGVMPRFAEVLQKKKDWYPPLSELSVLIAEKDPEASYSFINKLPDLLDKHPENAFNPDLFLIGAIDSPRDAQAFAGLIDRQKYSAQYKRRIARFYG